MEKSLGWGNGIVRNPHPKGAPCQATQGPGLRSAGPLLYVLPIWARMELVEYERDGVPRKAPFCDRHLYPETPWNYGFASDTFQAKTHPLDSAAFSRLHPPVTLTARVAQIPWKMAYGVCTEEPDRREPVSGPEEVLLYPYGCTDL